MIRVPILAAAFAAALTGCSHMEQPTSPTPSSAHEPVTVDRTLTGNVPNGVPVDAPDGVPGRAMTLDEAAAGILGSGKYETATFALG